MRTFIRRLLAVGLLLALAGCDTEGVTIAYEPAPGETYSYRYGIESSTTRVLEGAPPVENVRSSVIEADHRVIEHDGEGVRLEVSLVRDDEPERRYEVRFDRSAQLVGIDRVDGVALGLVGEAALSDLFTSGPPPTGALRPGDSWPIEAPLELPETARPVVTTGSGRLVELGVVGDVDVAVVESELQVPVSGSTDDGRTAINGLQHSRIRITYALEDGSVVEATSATTGEVRLVVQPPPGVDGRPVTGWLEYQIETTTDRIDDGH